MRICAKCLLFIVFFLFATSSVFAADPELQNPEPRPGALPAPENAGDKESREKLRDQLTASIRNDASLSDEARKVEVSVGEDGRFELRGDVRSHDEIAKIRGNAIALVGAWRLVDHLKPSEPPPAHSE